MREETSFHSICRWTFHAGKGGFVPPDSIPEWAALDTPGCVELAAREIRPRLPEHIRLGMEFHYDYEVDEGNAGEVADALVSHGIHLALFTPGAHRRFAYGGIASLDAEERRAAEEFGERALELAHGPLRPAWHSEPALAPSFVLWNGSWGYDLASAAVAEMYRNLKESVAALCRREVEMGGGMFMALEPKPNEGHPAMLLPTVASAILFWKKLEDEYGVDLAGKGINKEFGHTEMVGLDLVHDTVEEVDNGMLVHMHVNGQGYNDGVVLGGPGKYDIDHGARINGMNVAVAGLALRAGYARWKGHDMQPRPYDRREQAVDRVVRSILSWEACEKAAQEMDHALLLEYLTRRETAKAEDLVREAVASAWGHFKRMYRGEG
ncbi:MAG: xylose isomerase [Actinomycetota bacterium]|nr:xylose isomerase [Actinomycetota bacterium]